MYLRRIRHGLLSLCFVFAGLVDTDSVQELIKIGHLCARLDPSPFWRGSGRRASSACRASSPSGEFGRVWRAGSPVLSIRNKFPCIGASQ